MKGFTIAGEGKLILKNAHIIADKNATDNILYIPKDHTLLLKNCTINFLGSNSLLFLRENNMSINVSIFNNSTLFIDKAFSTNKTTNIVISEQTSVFIGRENLYSFDVWFRTADPHLIYDCTTHQRTNQSKSIFVGDHVWIGQDCLIMKNSFIGSGAIIGAKSLCSNKDYRSNCIYGGSPARLIRENVFFTKDCVHNYTDIETEQSQCCDNEKFIFTQSKNPNHKTPRDLMEFLDNTREINKRIEFLTKIATYKDRYYI